MPRAFVIRPFGERKDSSGKVIDFERVQLELFTPALQATGFGGGTTGEIVDAGNIREDMFALILEADLVVCDITMHNANVFYELGIRHALRKKCTILVKGQPAADAPPFDILTDRYLPYPIDEPATCKDALVRMIQASLAADRPTDSPVFLLLPNLTEADPATIVPLDFREEVDRARSAQRSVSRGWLRLLSGEVRKKRFETAGLKLIAAAQWALKDYEAARESWETVRDLRPADLEANLALANIYERLFREQRRPELRSGLIEASDQAVRRVLSVAGENRRVTAEALALLARNEKSRWRGEFEGLADLDERRRAATNQALVRSYEAYRKAYLADLNHSYPGLAALQMGRTLLELSVLPAWSDIFDSDAAAEARRVTLADEVKSLRAMVQASIEAELARLRADHEDRVWVEISEADLRFLTAGEKEGRVLRAYADAIPLDKPFAWDAAGGQLDLFRLLGIGASLAEKVIGDIDGRFQGPGRPTDPSGKPTRLVILAGHQLDGAGRAAARFPAAKETRARELLLEQVRALADGTHEVVGLGSAAPGTDILLHEILADLGCRSTVCLPMPVRQYSSQVFGGLDTWRNRFLKLLDGRDVLELSDRAGLPKWLDGSAVNPWERGNRWVTQLAETWGAKQVTLLALWDGKDEGDAPGGTAQMVRLARDAGRIDVVIVDAKQLLD